MFGANRPSEVNENHPGGSVLNRVSAAGCSPLSETRMLVRCECLAAVQLGIRVVPRLNRPSQLCEGLFL
jgi:hypothetical protein